MFLQKGPRTLELKQDGLLHKSSDFGLYSRVSIGLDYFLGWIASWVGLSTGLGSRLFLSAASLGYSSRLFFSVAPLGYSSRLVFITGGGMYLQVAPMPKSETM